MSKIASVREPSVEVQRELITKMREELAAIAYLNQLKIEALNAQTPLDSAGEKYREDQIAEFTLGIENCQKAIELMEKKLAGLPRPASPQVAVPLLQ